MNILWIIGYLLFSVILVFFIIYFSIYGSRVDQQNLYEHKYRQKRLKIELEDE
jgi:hypothetical protein